MSPNQKNQKKKIDTKKQNWTETMFVQNRNMLPELSEQIQANTRELVRSLLLFGNEIVSECLTN